MTNPNTKRRLRKRYAGGSIDVSEERSKFAAQNPVNRSSSKQMFSFSKSPRKGMFNKVYTDAIYDLPSSVNDTMLNHKKTPSFQRSVLGTTRLNATLRKSAVPAPGTYSLKSDIEVS